MITIAALVLSVKLGALLDRLRVPEPQATCGIETTSYLFKGEPGTEFGYAGETVRLPESGSVELIASRGNTYEVAGRKLGLDVSSADEFGRRTIQVPSLDSPAVTATRQSPAIVLSALPAVTPKRLHPVQSH